MSDLKRRVERLEERRGTPHGDAAPRAPVVVFLLRLGVGKDGKMLALPRLEAAAFRAQSLRPEDFTNETLEAWRTAQGFLSP